MFSEKKSSLTRSSAKGLGMLTILKKKILNIT